MPTAPVNPSAPEGAPDRTLGAELGTPHHLALMFDSVRDMMMLARVEPGELYRILRVNPAYLATVRAAGFALDAADLEGRTFAEAVAIFGFAAPVAAELRARYEEVIRHGRPVDYEEVTRTPAGDFHGQSTITPIPDGSGAVRYLLYTSQDVTARKLAERQRDENERTVRAILDHAFEFIGLLDPAGRVLRANRAALAEAGVAWPDVAGKYFWETPWWIHSAAEQARVRDAIARAAQGEFVRFETTHRGRSGALLAIDFSLTPVHDERGAVVALVPEGRDVTERRRSEQALSDSEDKFATAFQLSPHALSIVTLDDGRYLEVNRAHVGIFGYPPEEILGRTAVETGLLPDPTVTNTALAELHATGRVREVQIQVRTRDGRSRTILNSAERIRWGGRDCALLASQDITDRLQVEKALRESEAKFEAAFRVSPDLISISDYETGRYLDVNAAHAAFFGFSREEMIGRSPLEIGLLLLPEIREEMLRHLEAEGHIREFRVPARTRDGRDVVLSLSAETIHVQGRKCILRVSRDITATLQAERALRESEAKFATAFRASPFSVTISDLESGRYVDVNVGFERISGYRREEVLGKTSVDLGLWTNPADRLELVRRVQRDGSARHMEIRFRSKHGAVRVALCSCEVIELAGQRCLLNVLEDITERRQAEEQNSLLEAQLRQNQKLEALGTLAGGIAHDFNNILTAIMVNQELALMDLADPPNLRTRLEEIGLASQRAKELVRQILTFSRQQKQERLVQSLQPIVQEALQLLRSSLPATIAIQQDLAAEAPAVRADAGQIHQVVMNLCTNAAHAMRERGGRLSVRLLAREFDEVDCRSRPGLRPGRYAQLAVADTGHGMDAAVLSRIFEPFFTTKGPGEGTGLGLAVVHGIVRDHDGGVFVDSLPGQGTTFELFFPEAKSTAGGGESPGRAELITGRGESIMVVEDEPAIADAVSAMLRKLGYRVTPFNDPRAALEEFRRAPTRFDLVLTDHTMPHLTGPELVARLHEWWPATRALLMSGFSPPETGARLRESGIRAFLSKPPDLTELARVVHEALTAS